MDEAIINHIKRDYKLLIGQQTSEEIKLEIGSAWDMKDELQAEVRGRDMLTGLPKTVILTSEEIRRALDEPVTQIIEAIKSTLDKTPPELAADIMDRGIVLAGGGALLNGPRRAAAPRDADARAPRREPAHLRRGRLGPEPRGVRGDPPLEPGPRPRPQRPPQDQPAPPTRTRPAGSRGTLGRWHLATAPRAWRCWARLSGAPEDPAASPRGAANTLVRRDRPRRARRRGPRAADDLLPLADERRAPRRAGLRRDRAAAVPDRGGARRAAVPRRLRLLQRAREREVGEREAAGASCATAGRSANANLAAAQRAGELEKLMQFEQGATYPKDYRSVNTTVISYPSGPFAQQVTIAAGSSSGIRDRHADRHGRRARRPRDERQPRHGAGDAAHRSRQQRARARRHATASPASSATGRATR